MDNQFEIPVTHDGHDYLFEAVFIPTAYSYRIEVNVFKHAVYFEPDEERNFRAVVPPEDLKEHSLVDRSLLSDIAKKLVELFKD